ncbi:MAG TPA: phosphoglycerate dehydrogenase [Steroidobacteraceae bacterium]|jgi:D-3-phosphoglycerate dehydrogenase|nr:phosphoglycerate dehydrogenase [Steroidobacteraceae bacterium]
MGFRILTLNNISVRGLERLPRQSYEVSGDVGTPDAILVRSADMHKSPVASSVLAVARAGAGVNNIPVEQLSQRGVPVFNAPGANANAVKELVLAGLFLAARNICQAWAYARDVAGDDKAIDTAVEAHKKNFVGFELPGRTLGVIGLGAIGVQVANSAHGLGMKVLGYDPQITVTRAWQLSSSVEQALSLDDLFARADIISVHVPLLDATRGLINAARLGKMRPGSAVLNFSRAPIVNERDMVAALDAGHLHAYICDFPSNALKSHPRAVTLPHLGASTNEAEENCAIMAADSLREFLEQGQIRNSVNFPEAVLPRQMGSLRIAIANRNVPNMVGQISTCLAGAGLNITELLNRSLREYAYTLVDAEGNADEKLMQNIRAIDGVLSARLIRAAE